MINSHNKALPVPVTGNAFLLFTKAGTDCCSAIFLAMLEEPLIFLYFAHSNLYLNG